MPPPQRALFCRGFRTALGVTIRRTAGWRTSVSIRRDCAKPAGRLGQFCDPVSGVDGIADNGDVRRR
jgi:hypothetical protein